MQLGKIEEALIYAKKAASKIDSLPKTHYQDFIKNTIELVNSSL